MAEARHDKRYPGEDSEYRDARNRLLAAEIELDEKVQQVAALRRELPKGGPVASDYEFTEWRDGKAQKVRLSELFPDGKDTLMLYSFMYSSQMDAACPACTSIADGFSGVAQHVGDRMGLVLVAKSPAERFAKLATSRGWGDLRIVSSTDTTYNSDYFAETPDGTQMPAANVFVRDQDGIRHFWGSEMLYVKKPGHPRHVDQIWPLWNMLDLTPEGRGTDWFPQLSY